MDTPTGSHFNGKTFNGKNHKLEDLQIIPFERVRPANNPFVCKAREKYWINNYRATKFGGHIVCPLFIITSSNSYLC